MRPARAVPPAGCALGARLRANLPITLTRALRRLRAALLRTTALVSFAGTLFVTTVSAATAQVVADGNTATSIVTQGTLTSVTTGTVSNNYGVNTFSQFNVGAGDSVNIHAPSGTLGSINIVNGSQSQIQGAVTGMLNNAAGGDLYIANPNGFVVGPNGSIHAGAVHLSTPTQGFVDALTGPGGPDAGGLSQIVGGTAPQGNGSIDIQGTVRGETAVTLTAGGNITISGDVEGGGRSTVLEAAVNTGGSIRIMAGGDVTVANGGTIRAEGENAGNGGSIVVFAEDDATLAQGGSISAAALGSGDGGEIEFSATDVVELRGRLAAGSDNGAAGSILIDPLFIIVATNDISPNTNVTLVADTFIDIQDGVTLSTRRTGGGNQVTTSSIGNSGNLTLRAPVIRIGEGAQLLTHATDGFEGGNLTIAAHWPGGPIGGIPGLDVGGATILADGALLMGHHITISAETVSQFTLQYGTETDEYNADFAADGVPEVLINLLEGAANASANAVRPLIDAYLDSPVVPGLSIARAEVSLKDTNVAASGNIDIDALATARTDFSGSWGELASAIGVTLADAQTIIEDSHIVTTGSFRQVTIDSTATTDVDIAARIAAVSLSVTDSLVAIRNSTLDAGMGTLSLNAQTNETQRIDAVASDETEAVATILSIRAQKAETLVDAEAGLTGDDSLLKGGGVSVNANATRGLYFTASADATGDDIASVAAVISVASNATRVVMGGNVDAGGAYIGANAIYNYYWSYVDSRGGTMAALGSDPYPVGMIPIDWLESVKDLAAEEQDAAIGTGDSAATDVTGGAAYTIGLNFDSHFEDVETIVGGSYRMLDLGDVRVETDALLTLDSEWRVNDSFVKRTDVRSNADQGATGAISVGTWEGSAQSLIGDDATIVAGSLTVVSDVTLPSFNTNTRNTLESVGDGLGNMSPYGPHPQPGWLEAGDLMPHMYGSIHPEDWLVTNIVGAGTGGSTVSIDLASHHLTVAATAAIGDGTALDVAGLTQVQAGSTGSFLSRSIDPDAPDVVGSGLGVGGAVQMLDVKTSVDSLVGHIIGADGTDNAIAGSIGMLAANNLVLGVYGGARGNVENVAVAGALSILDYTAETRAHVDAASRTVTSGIAAGAFDRSLLMSLAGGGAVGTTGVGLGAALLFADRVTVADISSFAIEDVATGATLADTGQPVAIPLIFLNARDESTNLVVAAAGAAVPGEPTSNLELPAAAMGDRADEYEDELGEQTVDPAVEGNAAGQHFGFSIAADFAGAFITTRTVSAIETDANMLVNSIFLDAMQDSDLFLSAGAMLDGAGATALGGSLAMANVRAEQIALDRGGGRADLTPDGFLALTVKATDSGDTRLLSASRAGQTIESEVIGSGAWLNRNATTAATTEDAVYITPIQADHDALGDAFNYIIAGSVAEDVVDETAEDADPEPPELPPGEEPPEEPAGPTPKGVSVGLTYARIGGNETVVAGIKDTGALGQGTMLDLSAKTLTDNIVHANSSGAAGAFAVAGTAVVINTDQTTTAVLSGTGTLPNGAAAPLAIAGTISVDAVNDGYTWATISAQGDAETLAAGSSVINIDDTRTTTATIDGVTIVALPDLVAPTIDVTASTEGIVQAYQRAGGGDAADYGLAIMLGVVEAHWATSASIEDSTVPAFRLDVIADESARIINTQDGMATADKGGGAAGTVVTIHHSDVEAAIEDSTVDSALYVNLDATSQSIITSRAVQSGEGKVGAGAVVGNFKADGTIAATIANSTITAPTVNLTALDQSWREITANPAVTANVAGIAGGLTIDVYKRDTLATISGGKVTSVGLTIEALSHTRSTNVALGRASGAELIGVAAQVAWITDDRDVIAEIDDTELRIFNDLTVKAERTDAALLLQATVADSAVGVGIGAGVFRLGGSTNALITTGLPFAVDRHVNLLATDRTTVVSIGFGAGTAGEFSGVGSLGFVDMGRRPADASALQINDRGAAERELIDDVRADIADLLEQDGRAGNDLNTARNTTISALMTVTAGDTEIGGNLNIAATDSRAAVVLAGQLQAGMVGGVLSYLDDYVEIGSITTNGVELSFHNIDLVATGDEFSVELDLGKPWMIEENPDSEDPEFPDGEEPLPPDEESLPPGEEPLPPGDGGDSAEDEPELSEDSDAADEFLEETDGSGGGLGALSIGLALARTTLGGTIDAGLIVHDNATVTTGGYINIDAVSTGETVAIAAGAQTSNANFGSSAAIGRHTQLTRASIDSGGTVNADYVDLDALTNGSAITIAAILTSGQSVSAGATVSVNDIDTTTEARITDATVVTTAEQAIDLRAADESNSLGLAFSGGSGGGVTGNMSLGVNMSRSVVLAAAIDTTLTANVGDIDITAVRDQSVTGLVMQLSMGSGVNAGAALAIADMKGSSIARADDSDIYAADDVRIVAENDSALASAAVGATFSGGAAVSGSLSISTKGDTVRAEISSGDVTAEDSVLVEAQNGGNLDSLGGGDDGLLGEMASGAVNLTFSGAFGVGASLSIIDAKSTTEALVTGNADVVANGSGSDNGVTAVGRETENDRFNQTYHGIAVVADNDTTVRGLAVTVAGGTVAVSMQVPIITVTDTTRAKVSALSGQPDLDSASDITVAAANDTSLTTFSLTGAAGITGGIGADVEYLRLEKTTEAVVGSGNLDASRDILVEALAPDTVTTLSLAGGFGATVGLAGIVQIAVARSTTQAIVSNSSIVAGDDFDLSAIAPRIVTQVAGSFGAAVIGAGGTILVLDARDTVRASVADGQEPPAPNAASPNATTLDVNGDVTIAAETDFRNNPTVIGGSAGVGALSATVLVTSFEQDVDAQLGDYATVTGGTNNLIVSANQVFDQSLALGSGSFGVVGVGATIGYTSLRNSVTATIGEHATVGVSGDVTVLARAERELTGGALAIGGGVLTLKGSVLVAAFGRPGETEESGAHFGIITDDLENGDPYTQGGHSLSNGDSQVASFLAAATDGRRSVDLDQLADEDAEDTIVAAIGDGAQITAGSNIEVVSEELGNVSVFSGAADLSIAGVTGGVVVVKRGSTIQTEIGSGANLQSTGGNITVAARADVDTGNATAFAGGLGLVSLNGASSTVETARDMGVLIEGNAQLQTATSKTITITVEEKTETTANATGAGMGLLALGATVATARATSELVIDFGGGNGANLVGGDVDIAINRTGDVRATALGAQGGVVSGAAIAVTARDATTATVDLGAVDIINPQSATSVSVNNDADVTAHADGVAIGLAGVGAAFATAHADSTSEVVGTSAGISTGNLDILVSDSGAGGDRRHVLAHVTSMAGGGFAAVAGDAQANTSSTASIDLVLRDLTVINDHGTSGNARFTTLTSAFAETHSNGFSGGLVAAGANHAGINLDSTSTIRLLFNGVARIDNEFEVAATGDDRAKGKVISGSGGAVVVNGSFTTINARPTTAITLDGSMVIAKVVDIHTERGLVLDNSSDSRRITIVGIGGSRMITNAEAETDIDLDLEIRANDLAVAANTEIRKVVDGNYNGQVGEGGLVAGSSLYSQTTVTNDVEIDLHDDARLYQGRTQVSGDATGDLTIAIRNDYDIADKLKIDTGGGILVPSATSEVTIETTQAAIRLDNAEIDALNAVDIGVTTGALVNQGTHVSVYGLAGRPYAVAATEFTSNQAVDLASSEVTSRTGTVEIAAGASGLAQYIDLNAETRIWNGTALPIGAPPIAAIRVEQHNAVSIDVNSSVLAATDVTLVADDGSVRATAFGASSDIYGTALNALGDLFSADDTSVRNETGTTSVIDADTISIEGEVIGGAFATRLLHVGPSGVITESEGDIDYALVDDVDLYENLRDYIEHLEEEFDEHIGDAATRTRLREEINRLEAILAGIGNGGRVDMLVIDDVFASGGNVSIYTDLLFGDGDIVANGDVLIEVLNQSERVVEVRGDIEIPRFSGGTLRYNGVAMTTNAAINDMNVAIARSDLPANLPLPPLPQASFVIDTSGPSGPEPRVIVRNDFLQNNANGTRGDLLVTGTINNPNGEVTLATLDGDVMVLGGEINARTVSISSGGDFFLSAGLDELLTNTGSDPQALYADFFEDYAEWAFPPGQPNEPPFQLLTGSGEIVAVGGVYIYADYLNINGLIKSGVVDWNLEIDSNLRQALNGFTPGTSQPVVLHAGLQTSTDSDSPGAGDENDIPPSVRNAIRGNVTVRWDPETGELLIDPIVSQGGFVELVGKVISTGGGRIEAASGYGHLTVDSATDLSMVFSRVDTGPEEGFTGEIRIVDTGDEVSPGSFRVTRYVKEPGGDIRRYRTETDPPGGPVIPTIILGDETMFGIAKPYAVTYHDGVLTTFHLVFDDERLVAPDGSVFSESSIQDFGDGTIDFEDFRATLVDVFGATQLANNPYKYDFLGDIPQPTQITATPWIKVGEVTIGGVTYDIEQRDHFEDGVVRTYDSHRLAANYDIAIDFDGFANSKVEVTSAGNLYFDGMFRNTGGETILTSTGASVRTVGDAIIETALLTINADDDIGRSSIGFTVDGDIVRAGTSESPMLIDLVSDRAVDLIAGNTIRIAETRGNLQIRQVKSTGDGIVELSAPGSILVSANAEPGNVVLVRAGALTMTAESGSIGTEANPLRIGSDLLTASAASDINLWSVNRDIYVDSVVSATGDVYLTSAGAIRDGNSEQTLDRRAAAGVLDELWDDLGLRDNGNSRLADAAAAVNAHGTAAYFSYWETRGLITTVKPNGEVAVTGTEAYNPTYKFTYSNAERAELATQGLSGSEIARLEDARTAEFHASHQLFGGSGYNPNYQYTASLAEIAAETRNLYWTTNQLQNGLSDSLVTDTTNTEVAVEAANVVGRNILLNAGTSIGEQTGILTITENYIPDATTVLALAAAEPEDIELAGDRAYVYLYDDLDIDAFGQLTAVANNNILISSESDIEVRQVVADLTVRLKSAQGIVAGDDVVGQPHIRAETLVLEGGAGMIGSTADLLTLGNIASLTARSTGDVALFGPLGNLGVSQIFSATGNVTIGSLFGSITDADDDDDADIVAQEIFVTAGVSIGEIGDGLDIVTTLPGGRVSLIANHGHVIATVPDGNVVATAIGSVEGDVDFAVLDGDLTLAGVNGQPAISAGGTLNLTVHGDVTGPAGLVPEIAATFGATFNIRGDFGTATNYVVTQIGQPNTNIGAPLSVHDLNNAASEVYIANGGEVAVGTIDLNGRGVFKLANVGEIHFADGANLDVGAIDIATVGADTDIIIDKNLTVTGDTFRVLATGVIEIAGNGNIDFSADTTLLADGIRETTPEQASAILWMVEDDDLTVRTNHAIDIRRITTDGIATFETLDVGGVSMVHVRAGTLNISTFFGDVNPGDVVAVNVDIDANGNVAGTYEVAESLDIHSTLGIGTADEDLSTPLVIDAATTATSINLAGEYGVNVRVAGQADLTFTSLQTAMRREGTVIDGDGTILFHLQDTVDPGDPPLTPEQLLGVGVILDAPQSTITIADTGIVANGAPIAIDARTYIQTADLQSGGGDVSILGRNGAFAIQLEGDVRSDGGDVSLETRNGASIVMATGAEIDAGAGRIVIDSAGGLTLGHLLSGAAGSVAAPTFAITTNGVVAALGTGAAIRGTSPDSFLSLDVGSIANAGPTGFVTDVAGLSLAVDTGDVHVRNTGDLTLAAAINNGGGAIDLFVQGNLDLDGAVSSLAGNGTRGDVALTATGNIAGALTQLVADEVYLNALAGRIGASPLIIDDATVRRYEVFGWQDVELQIDGPFGASHLISATGSVKVTAGPVEIGIVGARTKATIVSASAIVGRYGSPNPVVTLPDVPGLILPQSYLDAAALVPGELPPLPPVVPDDPDQPVDPGIPDDDGVDLDRLRELRRHIGGIDVVPPSGRIISVIRTLNRAVAAGRISIDIGDGLPGGGPADSDDDDEDDETDED